MQPPQDDKKQQRRQWLTQSTFGVRPPRQGGQLGSRPQQPLQQPPLYPPPQTPPPPAPTRPRSQTEGSPPPKVDTKALVATLLEKFKAIHGDFDKYHALNPDPNSALSKAHDAFRAAVQQGNLQAAAAELRKLKLEIRKAQLAGDRRKVQQERANYVQQIAGRLAGRAKLIKGAAFQQGMGKQLEKELVADKHPTFKAFVRSLQNVETTRDANSVAALKLAAETAKQNLQAVQKPTPHDQQRLAAIENALKQVRLWELAEEQDALATMPEGPEKEHRAGALFSKMIFEEGDTPANKLEGGESGQSGAWWVERAPGIGQRVDENSSKKQFLFKPMDAEGPVAGFPKGGSAGRESLAKTTADAIQEMTGLDFVPPTYLVNIATDKLPGSDPNGKVEFIGSLQQFAPSKGTAKQLDEQDPTFKNTKLRHAPKAEVHKLALLDMLTLNTDRHHGNIMIGGGDGDQMKIVPIDHGLTFPSREGLATRSRKMGMSHNVLQYMDAKEEPFDEDMQERIDLIDTAELEQKMRDGHATLAKMHPEAAALIDIDESVRLVKRSTEFLKKASKELSVGELMAAYSNLQTQIFDSTEQDKDAQFDAAIKQAKADGAATRELKQLCPDVDALNVLGTKADQLGWGDTFTLSTFPAWAETNPRLALAILKGNLENPAARREADERIAKLGGPNELEFNPSALTLDMLLTGLRDLESQKKKGRLNDQLKALGINTEPLKPPQRIAYQQQLEEYNESGGDAALQKLGFDPGTMDVPKKFQTLLEPAFQKLNANGDYERLLAEFPNEKIPKEKASDLGQKLQSLKMWHNYEKLGGNKLYFALGGDGEVESLSSRLENLQYAIRRKNAAQELDFDGKTADELKEKGLVQRLLTMRKQIDGLPEQAMRDRVAPFLTDAQTLKDQGDFANSNKKLDEAQTALANERNTVAEKAKKAAALTKKLTAQLNQISQVQDRSIKMRLVSAYKTATQHKDDGQLDEAETAIGKLETVIALALQKQQGQ